MAEALGFQGGKFTGIPMTSERMLTGLVPEVPPTAILGGEPGRRTSREEVRKQGMAEPTATIVWKWICASGLPPEAFFLWNAFPWHPYRREKGLLSNRPITPGERAQGLPVLEKLYSLLEKPELVAVGNHAHLLLEGAGLAHRRVRHPANGGAALFRSGMDAIINQS